MSGLVGAFLSGMEDYPFRIVAAVMLVIVGAFVWIGHTLSQDNYQRMKAYDDYMHSCMVSRKEGESMKNRESDCYLMWRYRVKP